MIDQITVSVSKVAMKSKLKYFKEQQRPKDFDDTYQYYSSIESEGKSSSFFNNRKSNMKDNDEYNVQYYNNCDAETNVSTKKIDCQNKHRLQCQKFHVRKRRLFPHFDRGIFDTIMIFALLSLLQIQGNFFCKCSFICTLGKKLISYF